MINIPSHTDTRGTLSVVSHDCLPFVPQRTFWITDVPSTATRGGHAHADCAEVIFPLQGSFRIFVDDHHSQHTYLMNNPTEGIYIGPNVWCELKDFSPGTIALVFASTPYLKDGYINDYRQFRQLHVPHHTTDLQ